MADRLFALHLYTRRWHLGRQAAITIGCGLLWLAAPLRLYDVPAREGVQGALWPLVPALFAAPLPAVFGTAAELSERMAPYPARLRSLALLLIAGLAAALITCGAPLDTSVALRNTLLLVGLALCSSWLLPAAAAWAPVVLTPMVMWLVGTKPYGQVESWAVLLLPGSVAYTWIVTAVVLGAGITGYLRNGPRG
jgi:hypothetical protein